MPATAEATFERRQQTSHLIEELQKERQEVWSLYCHVAELKPFSFNDKTKETLNQFSQILIDYISLGHFGVYEKLISGSERRNGILSNAKDLYSDFSKTTEAAISFNDKYERLNKDTSSNNLEQDLSELGENLAKRIEMEDQLCNMLLH